MDSILKRALAAVTLALALGAAGAAPAAAADPMLSEQWALRAGTIGAPEAWTQSRGEGVLVAIVDSGVQFDHPELAANMWTNPDEIAGNGVDDDANGYVDDIHGANIKLANGDADDDEGHGTHVAGIVAARGGNGAGGSGLAPGARIMAVKTIDAERRGDSGLLARGIRYAVDEGAKILNVSINGDSSSTSLDAAVRYAGEHGATIVASSGNHGRDIDLQPSYPASSAEPAIVTVGASDARGRLAQYSNRGLRAVDLAAPGDDILSTARGSGYENRTGTSMAAPFVAGTLALMAAARPDLGQAELRAALLASAPRRGLLAGLLGSGALDVAAAMHAILPGDMWRATPASAPPALRLQLRTTSAVRAGRSATLRWSAIGQTGVATWRVTLDGRRAATVSGDGRRVVSKRIARAGTHRWKVVGYDSDGARVASASRSFRVTRGA